jgi:hypothetical protein
MQFKKSDQNKQTPKITENSPNLVTLHTINIFIFCLCLSNLYQGCQIFLDTIYQNERKNTKLLLNCQSAIKYT